MTTSARVARTSVISRQPKGDEAGANPVEDLTRRRCDRSSSGHRRGVVCMTVSGSAKVRAARSGAWLSTSVVTVAKSGNAGDVVVGITARRGDRSRRADDYESSCAHDRDCRTSWRTAVGRFAAAGDLCESGPSPALDYRPIGPRRLSRTLSIRPAEWKAQRQRACVTERGRIVMEALGLSLMLACLSLLVTRALTRRRQPRS